MSAAAAQIPPLFPHPRRISRLPGTGAAAHAPPQQRRNPKLGAEEFTLITAAPTVQIEYGGENGLRYALFALEQLRAAAADNNSPLPALEVHDAPDFPVRGYMLDISRDRVPTRATLTRVVELMAQLRLNHLQLYTEHTFAYPGHEIVWRNASPLTAEDVTWLDAQCSARGVELCANQNTFGHMERWLKHAPYNARAEAPQGATTKSGVKLRAATLAPTAENAAFALELCRELLRHHSSRRVNIGCDEPFELGLGKSRAEVQQRGRAKVYLAHLQRLVTGLQAENYNVMFWGDVIRAHPELCLQLPRDTTALVWHYDAPSAAAKAAAAALPARARNAFAELGGQLGDEWLGGFARHCRAFHETQTPFWVCPGTSAWNSFCGRLPNARGNLLDAAQTGLAQGARGMLITDWGDNGHMQPPSVSWPALAYGAALAWNCAGNRAVNPAAFLDRFVFEDEAGRLGGALDLLGGLAAQSGLPAFNGSPLFYALVRGGLHNNAPQSGALQSAAARARLRAVLENIAEADAALRAAKPQTSDGAIAVRELRQAARLARCGALRLAQAAGMPEAPAADAFARALREAAEEQRACWLLRSRPGGLEDSMAKLPQRDA